MVKRYSHHTFPVQSPHTMDAILFRDVNKRNCGYRPLTAEFEALLFLYPYVFIYMRYNAEKLWEVVQHPDIPHITLKLGSLE